MVPELYGFLIGVIAGLIPGIHPNTFASLMLGASTVFFSEFDSYEMAIIIFVSSVTYSVVNIIPAVMTGIPDEDTAIAILPAHRLVLNGEGMKAISVSAFSSFLSALFSLPIFYVLLKVSQLLRNLDFLTPFVLAGVTVYLVSFEDDPLGGSLSKWKKRFYAFLVFSASGILGFYSLREFRFSRISILFPLLSGLFAFPTLLTSMMSESIPKQDYTVDYPKLKNILKGIVSGLFVSIFPGISSGVATALSVGRDDDEVDYISSISSANTANTILNFAILMSLGKVRSGAAQAFSAFISPKKFLYLPFLAVSSAFSAMAFTVLFSIPAIRIFQRFKPSWVSKGVLVFLLISIFALNGFSGVAVFALAGIIGMSTLFLGVRRIHCMGSIILPAMLY